MVADREPFEFIIEYQPVEIGAWVMIELIEEFGLSHDSFRVAEYVGWCRSYLHINNALRCGY